MTPHPSHLPIQPGERPAMGARRLLERLALHESSGRPGWGLSARAGWAAAATLRAISQALRSTYRLDPSLVLDGWSDLPLLIRKEDVRRWERDKPWKQFNLPTHVEGSYQELLEGPTPSDAYVPHQDEGGHAREVWKAWLACAPREEVCNTLDSAADIWEQWLQRHPDKDQLDSCIRALSRSIEPLGAEKQEAHSIALLEAWWMEMASHFPATGGLLVGMTGRDWHGWKEACSASIQMPIPNLEGNAWGALLYHADLILKADGWGCGEGIDRLASLRTQGWGRIVSFWFAHGRLPWEGRDATSNLEGEASERWTHLDGTFEETRLALMTGAKLLILGNVGAGKSQLARDLVQAAGKSPVFVQGTAEGGDPMISLKQAELEVRMTGGRALVVDDHPDPKLLRDWILGLPEDQPLIVTSAQTQASGQGLRPGFDRVIPLKKMPVAARLKIASTWFQDESLALRVARSLHTPKAIAEAGKWCQRLGAYTWDIVRGHHKGSQHLETPGRDGSWLRVDDPVSVNKLPPLSGSPTLETLMDRLVLASERPGDFEKLGATPPKGAVLVGPPGTGKTLFGRHLSSRLGIPILCADPASLAENPELVAELFQEARAHAPCIVFMDEAEKIICKKCFEPDSNALGSLLTEIDGAEPLEGVLVIATTNNSQVSPALVRSGRLSEVHHLQEPLNEERNAIWTAYLQRQPDIPEDQLRTWSVEMAKASRGFTGADIAETLRKAAVKTVMARKEHMELADLMAACDDVRWAPASGRDSLDPHERRTIAVHEAGHALLSWRWGMDVFRITVRARDNALGMVEGDWPEQFNALSRKNLFGHTQVLLGGIAAEQARFGEYGRGGSSDLLAGLALTRGAFAWGGLGSIGPTAASRDIHEWSEAMRQRIDADIQAWSRAAFDEAVEWLEQHQALVDDLADCLENTGDLSGPELERFRQRTIEVASIPSIPDLQFITQDGVPGAHRDHQKHALNEAGRTLHMKGQGGAGGQESS